MCLDVCGRVCVCVCDVVWVFVQSTSTTAVWCGVCMGVCCVGVGVWRGGVEVCLEHYRKRCVYLNPHHYPYHHLNSHHYPHYSHIS